MTKNAHSCCTSFLPPVADSCVNASLIFWVALTVKSTVVKCLKNVVALNVAYRHILTNGTRTSSMYTHKHKSVFVCLYLLPHAIQYYSSVKELLTLLTQVGFISYDSPLNPFNASMSIRSDA